MIAKQQCGEDSHAEFVVLAIQHPKEISALGEVMKQD
jgi:hypothetical protein